MDADDQSVLRRDPLRRGSATPVAATLACRGVILHGLLADGPSTGVEPWPRLSEDGGPGPGDLTSSALRATRRSGSRPRRAEVSAAQVAPMTPERPLLGGEMVHPLRGSWLSATRHSAREPAALRAPLRWPAASLRAAEPRA
jgi:hypothetical protein